jgi:hypothetical protein
MTEYRGKFRPAVENDDGSVSVTMDVEEVRLRAPLRVQLAHAWVARAQRGRDTFMHAAMAPALFKPEALEAIRAEVTAAIHQARYWQGRSS